MLTHARFGIHFYSFYEKSQLISNMIKTSIFGNNFFIIIYTATNGNYSFGHLYQKYMEIRKNIELYWYPTASLFKCIHLQSTK